MRIHQIIDYTLLEIKEKNGMDKFKPTVNKTWLGTHRHKQNLSGRKFSYWLGFMAYQLS